MADHALRLLLEGSDDMEQPPSSNEAMVADVQRSGALRSADCIAAFQAIDRQHFWVEGNSELIYADMPLRHGRLHLSAPQIYAEALESLQPLATGMSFLNVGSGTGYFNSVVSKMIGDLSTNHGIDIWPEALAHATERCWSIGKRSIEFFLGNVYQLDVSQTMRYDRIYLGACANSRSKYLYRLLEVGGVLVGPFQAGRTQQLRRVVRRTETEFSVEVLESVRFASLVEPVPVATPRTSMSSVGSAETRTPPGNGGDEVEQIGLPGVPFNFSLHERPWTLDRSRLYPPSFRQAVAVWLRGRPRDEGTCLLPKEIWTQHIFPWCPRWWFEEQRPRSASQVVPATSPTPLLTAAIAPSGEDEVYPTTCAMATEDDDGDADMSDDGGSTRVPSAYPTPETGPAQPPPTIDTDEPLDLGNVLFEVFGNGQRHAIGADGDPDDDFDHDDGHRQAVPLQVLQLLAAAARTQRRQMPGEMAEDAEEEEAGEDEDTDEDYDEVQLGEPVPMDDGDDGEYGER